MEATKNAHEKLVLQSQDFADTAIALQQIISDLQDSKNVDSQAIRALRQVQDSHALTTQALTEQMSILQETIAAPKVVRFNRDDKGKILQAIAEPIQPNGV